MFCMLQRQFESELAEACAPSNYNIGLLPWSPLAAGVLSDKYFGADGKKLDNDKLPEGCRTKIAPGWMARYSLPRVVSAAEQYAVRCSGGFGPLFGLLPRPVPSVVPAAEHCAVKDSKTLLPRESPLPHSPHKNGRKVSPDPPPKLQHQQTDAPARFA